ncbi:MAG: nucleotidyl transferase AbiEii/AbiGii toxin family protein [Actinobacteria bacterium]|nr:nucleotidyl transferase AbiEii/AbiGii toxin family protein [Actinomycetota bacterium]
MISQAELAHWRQVVPWSEAGQVEQDLVLSRLIVEIARHPLLGSELVFRGGTCFHKLWLDRPWRYSEDLDYVRRTASGIGGVFDAIREVATAVGFTDIATQIGRHPKVRLRSTLVNGSRLQIKIEMNTFERSPARPTVTRRFAVESPWFTGNAVVPTFTIEEMTATKIRALFQRRKGRDLFDLWLAFEHGGATLSEVVDCFAPYRPDGWTAERALVNLTNKLNDEGFLHDLDALVQGNPPGYSITAARTVAEIVIRSAA